MKFMFAGCEYEGRVVAVYPSVVAVDFEYGVAFVPRKSASNPPSTRAAGPLPASSAAGPAAVSRRLPVDVDRGRVKPDASAAPSPARVTAPEPVGPFAKASRDLKERGPTGQPNSPNNRKADRA